VDEEDGPSHGLDTHCFNFQRRAIDYMPKGPIIQQFHRDESSPINLIDFVNGADIRVV
jgi:hypothetical protein